MAGPILLGYKATWQHLAPFAGSGGYLSGSTVSDAYTPENIEFYGSKGHSVIDTWAIYVSPDRRSLFTVNLDGTLRSMRERNDATSMPQPHPYWADSKAAV